MPARTRGGPDGDRGPDRALLPMAERCTETLPLPAAARPNDPAVPAGALLPAPAGRRKFFPVR